MSTGPQFYSPTGQPFQKPKAMDKLKEAWNENPLMVMAVIGAACAGVGKLIEAVGSLQSKRAYAKKFGK